MPQVLQDLGCAQEVSLDDPVLEVSGLMGEGLKDWCSRGQGLQVLHSLVTPQETPLDNPTRKISEINHIGDWTLT
jgi:hypothetical protein